MRLSEMILDIQARFDVVSDHELAGRIAEAMTEADHRGREGFFTHEGVTYEFTAQWKDGCINYDCNPATCYTDWNLTEVKPTE
jgi:hypothetical protein